MKNLTLVIFVALLCLTAFSQEDVNMCSQYDINTSSKKETQECLKQHLITLALRGDISWIIVAGPDINYVTTYTIANRNFFKPFFHSSFKVAVKVEWGTYNNNYYEFACITQPYRDKVEYKLYQNGRKTNMNADRCVDVLDVLEIIWEDKDLPVKQDEKSFAVY